MLLRTGIAALILALAVPVSAHAVTWRTYVNERFGSTADVPADWQPGEAPANGDGLRFVSPDGQAWIIVSGAFQTGDAIGDTIAVLEAPNEGEQVTYHHRETRLVVISGLKRDRIFYRKSILSCRDTVWNSIAFEYPAARKQAFDTIVVQVAKSLKPGKGSDAAQCGGQGASSRVTLISTGTLRGAEEPGSPSLGAGTSRSALASAEPGDTEGGASVNMSAAPQDQDMQRSDDVQSSHSDM